MPNSNFATSLATNDNVAHFAKAETERSESQPSRLRIFTTGTVMLHYKNAELAFAPAAACIRRGGSLRGEAPLNKYC